MRFTTRVLCIAAVLCSFLTFARISEAAKKYQVTGMVLEVTEKMIAVENKDKERWEIERTPDTKVDGDLKVGAKVTIYYTMSAASVEVKEKDKAKAKDN